MKLFGTYIALAFLLVPQPSLAKLKVGTGNHSMKGAEVFIVHGYMAAPESHWFPWLKSEIERGGGRTSILSLPDSKNPKLLPWLASLKAGIKKVDSNTIIVAHSLGCITALNFISDLPDSTRLGGFVCVSGFSEHLPNLPMLNEFTAKTYDVAKVKKVVQKRSVIVANDDQIVAPDFTRRLAKQLDAPLHSIEKGGHFLGSDGFTEFPLVWQELEKIRSKN